MNVELKGVLKVIFAEVQINDNLSKKEIVITIDQEQPYQQDIIIQSLNDKISLLDGFKMGDTVIVKCNLKGKKTNEKYFNQLSLWSIVNKNKE